MDPAMDADLVAFGDHLALFVGMEQGGHRRHVERRRHVVFLHEPQDARHADAAAILAPGQAADRFATFAQGAGFMIAVERDREGAARAGLPGLRAQRAAGADVIDQLAPVFLRPLPGFWRLLLVHYWL